MSVIINCLIVWFVISIPVAFFIAAVFRLSRDEWEIEEGETLSEG